MNNISFKIGAVILFVIFSLNLTAGVQAIFNYKQFQVPNKGIYIESYLSFVSSTLKYKSLQNDLLQANLLITQIVKKGDKVVDFKKYEV